MRRTAKAVRTKMKKLLLPKSFYKNAVKKYGVARVARHLKRHGFSLPETFQIIFR